MKSTIYILSLLILYVRTDRIKIHTTSPEKSKDYNYFPLKTNYLEFNVKSKRDVNIILCNQYDYNGPYYEIVIGAIGNTISVIKKNQTTNYAATHSGAIFHQYSYQRFWVSINDTEESISVGKSPNRPFLYLHDPDFVKMSIFGISSAWGSDAFWDFNYDILKYN